MKSRAIILIILFVLVVFISGCVTQPAAPLQTDTVEAHETTAAVETTNPPAPNWSLLLDAAQDEIGDWTYLPDGGLLVLYDKKGLLEEQYGRPIISEGPIYELLQVEAGNDGKQIKSEITPLYIPGPADDVTAIFYDEDWDTNPRWISYLSSFRRLKDSSGKESMVLIIVIPNSFVGQSYPESDYYQVEPSDSLNSVPMKIYRQEWMGGYPTWVYAISLEKITEDYELRYGEFVLTGTDILTDSWSIGDAKIMPYPGYE